MHYAQFKRNQPTNLKPVIWSNYYVAGESKSEKKAIESAEALIKIVTAWLFSSRVPFFGRNASSSSDKIKLDHILRI